MDELVQIVVGVGVGVVIIVSIAIYIAWRRARAAAAAGLCALFTPSGIIGMFPDECLGTCPGGKPCTPAGTRPYFIFWKQDAGPCTCPRVPPPVRTGVTPPGTGTAGGSGEVGPVQSGSR